jgi:DNA-binding MarR family transcriptional regulator
MDLMPDTRWLSDDEQRVWRDFAVTTAMLQAHLESQLQHEGGMPHTYYEVLVALSEAPDHTMRMSELADARFSSRSRLSHAVARLEASGWVRREACPTDKRGAWAVLTPSGFAALEAAAPGHVEAVRENLFDPLTPEQVTQLGEIMGAIRNRLSSGCSAAIAAAEPCLEASCAEAPRTGA